MKKTIFTLLTLALGFSATFAQTQVPDFKNSPMLVKSDGSLEKLEKQNSEIKTKNVPYVGVTRFISILGAKSPVRVKPNATFILKVDAETDPETVFYVQASKGAGKNREIDLEKMSAWAGYGAKGKSVKKDQVALSYEKVSDGVYKIKAEGLKSGTEYGFVSATQGSTGGQSTLFLFGVD